jgi:hypothetical protein
MNDLTFNSSVDAYEKWLLANRAGRLIDVIAQLQQQIAQPRQQFIKEIKQASELVTEWLNDHADQVVVEASGIMGKPEISPSGKVHLSLVVIKKQPVDWLDDPLNTELLAFEESLWKTFQIVRLNSLLFPDAKEERSETAPYETPLRQDLSEDKPIMSATGTPFEIVGFRTEKFEDHGDDISRVDRCSDEPEVMEVFRILRDIK